MNLQTILALVVISNLVLASAQKWSQNCERSCGNMIIPFPFGSEERCYYSPQFEVICNRSLDEPTLFFGDVPVTNISLSTGEMEIMTSVARDCYDRSGRNTKTIISLSLSTFQISTKNRFVAIGCDTYAYINGTRRNESEGTGCISRCDSNRGITNGTCSGIGCCKVAIPEGMSSFSLDIRSYDNHLNILDFNPCSHAFVVRDDYFSFSSSNLRGFETVERMPMLLDWAIGTSTCDIASKDTENFLCKGYSECVQNYTGPGYRCNCLKGYEGNPYIEDGCKDIDECKNPELTGCVHNICKDTEGSYECKCRKGYSGDGKKDGSGCTKDQPLIITITICE